MDTKGSHKFRVLFICGSIEPGKDGVGDYTRRLAAALSESHCMSAIVSVNDKHIKIPKIETEDTGLKTYRLPAKNKLKVKMEFIRDAISDFSPNWISLQYVPYAFQSQGVPLKFINELGSLKRAASWHIMFHEVHLGGVLSVKNHLVKFGQIKSVKRLVSKLQPALIHTSNSWYREMLENLNIETQILGLFGNIPVLNQPEGHGSADSDELNAIFFGAAPPEINFHVFGNAISTFLQKSNAIVKLNFLGRKSILRDQFAQYFKRVCPTDKLQLKEWGEKTPEELSKSFSKADFAIARVKPSLLGKSGAAIAMLEHGLKLWVPMAESQAEIESDFDYRCNQCFASLENLLTNSDEFTAESRVNEIAKSLVESFDRLASGTQQRIPKL